MEKAIQFKGISLDRSDQLAEIGELAYCHGAELRGGILRPSVLNKSSADREIPNGTKLLYIHEANGYKHPIYWDGSNIAYFHDTESVALFRNGHANLADITTSSIISMGNTLIINVPAEGLYYFRWSPNDDEYISLGQKPPMLSLRFRPSGLTPTPDYPQGAMLHSSTASTFNTKLIHYAFSDFLSKPVYEAMTVNSSRVSDAFDEEKEVAAGEYNETDNGKGLILGTSKKDLWIRDPYRATFTEAMWALINKTHDHIASEGRFYAPIIVRYAYRMFDGSVYCASAPILVSSEMENLPQLFFLNIAKGSSRTKDYATLDVNVGSYNITTYRSDDICYAFRPVDYALQYAIDSDNLSTIRQWSEVIKSVDIFISQPLVSYNDSQLLSRFYYAYSKLHDNGPIVNRAGESALWRPDISCSDPDSYYIADIPRKNSGFSGDLFSNVSTFFKIKSINLDDLQRQDFNNIEVERSVVYNITTQEQMSVDDYGQYSTFIPSGIYNYNHRLNIFGLYEKVFPGFDISNMLCAYKGKIITSQGWTFIPENVTIDCVRVKLSTTIGDVWVGVLTEFVINKDWLRFAPLYYPDSRAVLMELGLRTENKYISFTMKEHPVLNGSVTIPSSMTTVSRSGYRNTSQIIPVNDSILTSAADNPFIFPAANASVVGTGQVLDLCTAVRPLSQGQFGSFPLIAFCTDGIWALTVGTNGLYTAVNPISREVCAYITKNYGTIAQHHAKMILQLDQSLMFTTDRGLNQLSGSDVIPLTDVLKGKYINIKDYCASSSIPDTAKGGISAAPSLSAFPVVNGNMDIRGLYDWTNGRALFFNSSLDGKCLVYTASDKQFTTADFGQLSSIYNSYPVPYIQTGSGIYALNKQIDYSDTNDYNPIIITRHMSFGGYRDAITGLRHITNSESTPYVLIFGSNDCINDTFIGCVNRDHADMLPASPYRYFRLAIILGMKQWQTYSALVADITQKHSKL